MLKLFIPVLFAPVHYHLCFTQLCCSSPGHSCCAATDLWDLRGCDRGRPVSVSLRPRQWHLTQYPSRIRFPPYTHTTHPPRPSAPAPLHLPLWPTEVSEELRLRGNYYYGVKKRWRAGTPCPPPQSTSHPLIQPLANMPHPGASPRDHHVLPSAPRSPRQSFTCELYTCSRLWASVKCCDGAALRAPLLMQLSPSLLTCTVPG